jgi:hypothetical protein
MNSKGIKSVVIAAALLLGATSAFADTFDSTLTVFNVSGYTGPFGTVVVTTSGANVNTASITFTAASGYVLMDSSLADVNVNATSFTGTPGAITTHAGDTTPTITATGFQNAVDGWGTFNETFSTTSGFASAVDSFTFTLTDNSGTWASAADVLTANNLGYDAAAHIAPLSGNGVITGYAAEIGGTITSPTPEPASLGLLGTGLLAVSGMVLRRRWRPAV